MLTTAHILVLAARPEGFGVSWRYRDATLMRRCLRRCLRLVREGKLERGKRVPGGGSSVFHLVKEQPTT